MGCGQGLRSGGLVAACLDTERIQVGAGRQRPQHNSNLGGGLLARGGHLGQHPFISLSAAPRRTVLQVLQLRTRGQLFAHSLRHPR